VTVQSYITTSGCMTDTACNLNCKPNSCLNVYTAKRGQHAQQQQQSNWQDRRVITMMRKYTQPEGL
jgi:hypothetical protein